MITEKLLFAVHRGISNSSRPIGLIMENHCLPIACSHGSWSGCGSPYSEVGLYACWEYASGVEHFFQDLLGFGSGIEGGPGTDEKPNGVYVYEVSYELSSVVKCDDCGDDENESIWWEHLQGGTLRRPTIEELEPLTRGQAPWGGVVI